MANFERFAIKCTGETTYKGQEICGVGFLTVGGYFAPTMEDASWYTYDSALNLLDEIKKHCTVRPQEYSLEEVTGTFQLED